MRHPAPNRLYPLLLPVAVLALLAMTIQSSFASPLRAAGHAALAAGAASVNTQRSSHHLPYFSFVRALRPRS